MRIIRIDNTSLRSFRLLATRAGRVSSRAMTDIAAALADARRNLLDLSTRNRLLSLPKPGRSPGVITLADEDAGFVVTRLLSGKTFTFEAVPEAAEGKEKDWRGDTQLRVLLNEAEMGRRLFGLMRDARSSIEESGLNTLSLAIGALVWVDPATPGVERRAPLALLGVALTRATARAGYRLAALAEEAEDNLSLREKLSAGFGIALPPFPADYAPDTWAEAVRSAVAGQPGWRVEPGALSLGLFSYAKFLMHEDLDPARHPGLAEHPIVRALLGAEPLPATAPPGDDADVDALIPVERLDFVMDADGSQALATDTVRRGGHLVIQGPPGTGKSQVITNIIAQAVLDGRRVLFIAEKRAALEVVKRRLDKVGIGPACLELHSNKLGKRAVLDELRATLALPPVRPPAREELIRRLGALRGRLNRHAATMAAQVGLSGRGVHEVVGALVRLRADGVHAPDFRLEGAADWTPAMLDDRKRIVRELAARARELGGPADRSPWRGVTRDLAAPDLERALARLPDWTRALARCGQYGQASFAALRAGVAVARDPATARRLADAAAALATARQDTRLSEAALTASGLAEAREVLARQGGMLGFLSPARRRATTLLAEVARGAPPADPAACVALLDAAIAGAEALRTVKQEDATGRALFGPSWPDDVATMRAHAGWGERHGESVVAAVSDGEVALGDIDSTFGLALEDAPLGTLPQRLAAMAAAPEGYATWAAWRRAADAAGVLGLEPLASRLADGALAPDDAETAHTWAEAEALLHVALKAHPDLATFDGAAQRRLVEEYREADEARIALTRAEAAAAHIARLAEARSAPGMDVLRGEMERKRGFLPVRELLARAAPAIQLAKPVFLMSPLAIAQFLKPGAIGFDMLVMDEASQVEPVDALGGIARCAQVVVVGDDRQMPPTRFFQRITADADDDTAADDDSPVGARDVESILGLCNARGMPAAMLRWHYRSRHESLIATSNREFYDNRLLLLPSPRPRGPELGLSLVRVEGTFDTGATGTNREEARAVAEAVMAHARDTPGDSLGVAAFSLRQRDAILEALEELRAASPATEPFFTTEGDEPFFVKNLENVQGDERDAMFISIGYGRGKDGKVAMRFGPLSAEGGERRLNVLITRAKKRCVVFSGIGAEDIDLARAPGRGVAALKAYLAYAAAPAAAPAPAGSADGQPTLERTIGTLIEADGLSAVPRVGLAGVFVDIGVTKADEGGGYVLGVETDAPSTAITRSVRDRERGRDDALRMMGWKLHHTAALDWLNRPEAERARLRAALGVAPATGEAPAAPGGSPGVEVAAYEEAAFDVPAEPPEKMPFAQLAALLARIVGIEGPVHEDVLAERVRLLWHRDALDAAAHGAIAQGLKLARELNGLTVAEGFWSVEGQEVRPRNRRAAIPQLRNPAMIAPAEWRAAILALLRASTGVTRDEAVAGVERMLGIEGAGPAIAARLALLEGEGMVTERGGLLTVATDEGKEVSPSGGAEPDAVPAGGPPPGQAAAHPAQP